MKNFKDNYHVQIFVYIFEDLHNNQVTILLWNNKHFFTDEFFSNFENLLTV